MVRQKLAQAYVELEVFRLNTTRALSNLNKTRHAGAGRLDPEAVLERAESAQRADRDGSAGPLRPAVGLRRRPLGLQLPALAAATRSKRAPAKCSATSSPSACWACRAATAPAARPHYEINSPRKSPWNSISPNRRSCCKSRPATCSPAQCPAKRVRELMATDTALRRRAVVARWPTKAGSAST